MCLARTLLNLLDMEPASHLSFPQVQHLSSGDSFFPDQPYHKNRNYNVYDQELPSYPLKHAGVVRKFKGGTKIHRKYSKINGRVKAGVSKGKRRVQESSNSFLSSFLPSLADLVFGNKGLKREVEEKEGNSRRRSDDLVGSQSGTYDEKPQVYF